MKAKLYLMNVSHPAQGIRIALDHKGIETKIVKLDLVGGLHDIPLKLKGFKGKTVPAVKIEDRNVQGSMEIVRALDELVPEPPLLPADPDRRRAVEEAERWAHDVFQESPRTIATAALATHPQARSNFARLLGFPGFIGPALTPVVRRLAKGNTPAMAQATLKEIPAQLDRVDQLIADGTIGVAGELNAADVQIAPTVRLMLALEDLAPLVEGRPAAGYARRLLPEFAGPIPAGTVPAAWQVSPA